MKSEPFLEKCISTAFPGSDVPIVKDYKWGKVEKLSGIERKDKFFVIHNVISGKNDDLYLSFPIEGDVRIQTLHAYQKVRMLADNEEIKPEISNVGLFEPSDLATIDYNDAEGGTQMFGSDGTVAVFKETAKGFTIVIGDDDGLQQVEITESQIEIAYDSKRKVVRTRLKMPLRKDEAIIGGGERYDAVNHVGYSVSLVNLDCWTRTKYSYNNVPFFHSNK